MSHAEDIGRVVIATAGRDKGTPLVVVGTEGAEYLLLADGKRRKAQTPKRKKRRHIRATAYRIDPALFGDNAADAHLRKALRQLEENHDTDF